MWTLVFRFFVVLAALAICASAQAQLPPGDGGGGGGDDNTAPPEPIIDWQRKQDASGRLSALGTGLLGDRIDPHTGSLSFEHTDVSLPGNSSLDVSIRRRIRTGALYKWDVKAEFGDWELIVPRVKVTTSSASHYRSSNVDRCTMNNPLQNLWVPYPIVRASPSGGTYRTQESRLTTSGEYSDGLTLDVPGYAPESMRRNEMQGLFGNARYVTASGWKFDCLDDITGGGQGYTATAPNGTIYTFDRFYEIEAPRLGFLGHTDTLFDRYVSIVAATRATDVHGNTVDYIYDSSNRLEKIEASDGRIIRLDYDDGTDMISRVTANAGMTGDDGLSAERHWDYDYGTNSLVYYSRFDPILPWNGGGSDLVGNYPTLTSVTLPDGQSWSLDMQAMSAEVPSALSCIPETFPLSLTHPYGTKGDFLITPLQHKVTGTIQTPRPSHVYPGFCPNPEANSPNARGFGHPPTSLYYAPVWMMSATAKTLSGPNMPTMGWGYDYELDDSLWGPNDDQLNRTDVTQPDGTIHRYFHGWGTEQVIGNQLVKMQVVDNGAVIKEIDYTHIWEARFGWDGLSGGQLDFFGEFPRRVTKIETSQDGDKYTTEHTYNTIANASYSFGNPTQTRLHSTVSPTHRVFDYTYEHKTANWILNLPKKTIFNGRELIDRIYNAEGQKTSQSRYGQANYYTFAYHPDGSPLSATDALGRVTQATDWKRGTAQTLKSAYGSVDEITTKQTVDSNGWVTSQTDARDYTTTYTRDVMGRLTRITPSGRVNGVGINLSPTIINYYFGDVITQNIDKGYERQQIKYDSLFRPVKETLVVRPTPNSTVQDPLYSVTTSQYEASGRLKFKSLPHEAENTDNGTNYFYDALGRPTLTQSTFDSDFKTSYAYPGDNCIAVTDGEGEITTTCKDGYNGPGGGDAISIDQPEGIVTTLGYNDFGELLTVNQTGTQGGNQTQGFFYDDQRRLCGSYVPEVGNTIYEYDAAGQMTYYAKGSAGSAANCDSPIGEVSEVKLTYDLLGRPKTTEFLDPDTPDIWRDYDANSNVTKVFRGQDGDMDGELCLTSSGANCWFYEYDQHNRLKVQELQIDDRSFEQKYYYNGYGYMYRQTLPTGRIVLTTHDGAGRTLGVGWGNDAANGFKYHPNGQVQEFRYGNGLYFDNYQNELQQLSRRFIRQNDANDVIISTPLDVSYAYDKNGRISSQTYNLHFDGQTNPNNRTYAYDGAGRLISADSVSFGGLASFSYDALGNLTEKTIRGRSVTNTYDTLGRLTQSAETAGGPDGEMTRDAGYDDRGNITTLGGLSFIYDMADQPRAVSGTNRTGAAVSGGSYAYDGNLKRVKSVINGVTRYNVYDKEGRLAHVEEGADIATSIKTDYLHAAGMTLARIKNTGNGDVFTYMHPDHLGSASAGTNEDGTIAFTEYHTPFGEALLNAAANDNQSDFTGHIRDTDIGLIYMQARYMDPNIGRFLSVDPVEFMDTAEPGQFNRYAYTYNNPINMIDPDGNVAIPIFKKVVQKYATKKLKTKLMNSTNIPEFAIDLAMTGGDLTELPAVIGEALGGKVADKLQAGYRAAKKATKRSKTYQTYIKRSKSDDIGDYSGRTSGTGTPLENVAKRDRNHHMNDTHGPAELDRSSSNPDAIRGREDQNILANGRAQSAGGTSGNKIRGIAENNPKREQYHKVCNDEFC